MVVEEERGKEGEHEKGRVKREEGRVAEEDEYQDEDEDADWSNFCKRKEGDAVSRLCQRPPREILSCINRGLVEWPTHFPLC